jgi:hypothetical protein
VAEDVPQHQENSYPWVVVACIRLEVAVEPFEGYLGRGREVVGNTVVAVVVDCDMLDGIRGMVIEEDDGLTVGRFVGNEGDLLGEMELEVVLEAQLSILEQLYGISIFSYGSFVVSFFLSLSLHLAPFL